MNTKFKTFITPFQKYGRIEYEQTKDVCYIATSSTPQLYGDSTTVDDLLIYFGDRLIDSHIEEIKNKWRLVDIELRF